MFAEVCQMQVEVQWTAKQIREIREATRRHQTFVLDMYPQPRVPFVCLDQEHGRHVYFEFFAHDSGKVRQMLLTVKDGVVGLGPVIHTGRYLPC